MLWRFFKSHVDKSKSSPVWPCGWPCLELEQRPLELPSSWAILGLCEVNRKENKQKDLEKHWKRALLLSCLHLSLLISPSDTLASDSLRPLWELPPELPRAPLWIHRRNPLVALPKATGSLQTSTFLSKSWVWKILAIKIHFRPKLHIDFPSHVVLLTANYLSIIWSWSLLCFTLPSLVETCSYTSGMGLKVFLWSQEPGREQNYIFICNIFNKIYLTIFNKITKFLVQGTLKHGSALLKNMVRRGCSPTPASWEMCSLLQW